MFIFSFTSLSICTIAVLRSSSANSIICHFSVFTYLLIFLLCTCSNVLLVVGHCEFYIFAGFCWILLKSVEFWHTGYVRISLVPLGLRLSFLGQVQSPFQSVPDLILLLGCGSSGTLPSVLSYSGSLHYAWWKWTTLACVSFRNYLACFSLFPQHICRTGLDPRRCLRRSPGRFVQLSFPGLCLANSSRHGSLELWFLSSIRQEHQLMFGFPLPVLQPRNHSRQ